MKILSDFIFLLPEDSEKFLYLATPRMKESEISTSWEGKITEIRRAFLGNFANQRDVIAKKTKEIVNEIVLKQTEKLEKQAEESKTQVEKQTEKFEEAIKKVN